MFDFDEQLIFNFVFKLDMLSHRNKILKGDTEQMFTYITRNVGEAGGVST